MQITYFGHSCFQVLIEGVTILFDPFIRPNELAKEIDVSAIQPDVMCLTHGHADHVADAVEIAKQSGCQVVCNFEVGEWIKENGIENVVQMNHGGTVSHQDVNMKMVNAVHSSSLPDGRYGGNPSGFVVYSQSECFYYAGDTALHTDMRLIGEDFKLGLAFLPIGDVFTMDARDASKAAEMVRCDDVIGMHYNTFPPIEINEEDARREFAENGQELTLMSIGEVIDF
jgi:L-ascorbate metabolism protein UlaG (beta-lactamase superfamily)